MRPPTLRRVALAALAATFALPAGGAPAATPDVAVIKLADYVEGLPQLAVDRRGGAVATWIAYAPKAGGDQLDPVRAIFAAVRPARGVFGEAQRISPQDRDADAVVTAVGPRGHAAIAWFHGRRGGTLLVSRGTTGRRFGAARVLPGSAGALDPTVALDDRGQTLVAWRRSAGRKGCGMVVMATRATRNGRFGGARRISGPCARAALPRVVMTGDGHGVVAWREGGDATAAPSGSRIVVCPYATGAFGAQQTISTTGRVGLTLALASSQRSALVAWRDHGPTGRGVTARVLTATIGGGRVAAPVEVVTTRNPLLRDVVAAMSPRGDAIVGWQEGQPGDSVFDAIDSRALVAFRAAGNPAFGPVETVAEHLELDSGYGLTGLDVYGDGQAVAGYENVVARRSPGGVWVAGKPLQRRADSAYPDDMMVGASDAGELVGAWSLYSDDGGYYVRGAIIPPPAG